VLAFPFLRDFLRESTPLEFPTGTLSGGFSLRERDDFRFCISDEIPQQDNDGRNSLQCLHF
jgi:hypothetical protein